MDRPILTIEKTSKEVKIRQAVSNALYVASGLLLVAGFYEHSIALFLVAVPVGLAALGIGFYSRLLKWWLNE